MNKTTIATFLVLVVCLSTIASGAVIERLNIASLSEKADVVGLGRVVNLQTSVENGEPWTIVTVTIERALKGSKGSTVKFRIPGGQQVVNGRTLITKVEGTPDLNVNQRAVFFIDGRTENEYALTGLGQGFWRVETKQGKEVATPSADPEAPGIPLNRLIGEIEKSVRGKRSE